MELRPYAPERVVADLAGLLAAAVAERGRALLAVAGGRSPLPVHRGLAVGLDRRVREALHIFWTDERAVPRDDPRRNDAPALSIWKPPPPRCHTIPAEEPATEAVAAYRDVLARIVGDGPFDAVLLGMGEDGHIASLFPGHPAATDPAPVLAVADAPKPPPRRVTMGRSRLARARRILLLAPTPAKRAAIERHLAGSGAPPPCLDLPRERLIAYLAPVPGSAVVDAHP